MNNLLWPYISVEFLLLFCLDFDHSRLAIAVNRGNETDRQALLKFKDGISNDPLRILSSWNSSIHFCHWQGVACGSRHQRVVRLDLESQGLTGSISPYIGNLSFLRRLYLDNNTFMHEIPQEIGHLRRLRHLWLNNNSITGEIPANITACSDLRDIDFSYNKLEGKIPLMFGFLSSIETLYLDHNKLIGSIPFSIGNLSSMVELFLSSNNLSGIVPDSFGQLKNLQSLSLYANRLSGTFFPLIHNLSSLTDLDVSENQLKGKLPLNLPHLSYLSIADNQFTGSLPSSLSNMSSLEYLVVDGNFLTGQMPNLQDLQKLRMLTATGNRLGNGGADDLTFISDLINATNLEALHMNNNTFAGVLPRSLGTLSTNLVTLYLDNNQISGIVPDEIANLFNLEDLQLWNNKFEGNIPAVIGNLSKLSDLELALNKFTGNIPSSLGNLSMLIGLDLGGNNLQGSIPSSLGNCQNLLALDLSQNNLSGRIPRQIFSLSSLSRHLYLYSNLFTDSLPNEIGNLNNLGKLDVSNNMLSGEIPSSLGRCVQLEVLYMEQNFFKGTIPSSLSSLRGIQVLDLSNNSISGEIPEYFWDFNLLILNLSFNNFNGSLPEKGIFKNASAISVLGNSKLCGGIPDLQLPKCHLTQTKKHGFTRATKLVVSLVLGISVLSTACAFLFLFWFKRVKKVPATDSIESSLLNISYQTLLHATGGFSEDNLLGRGSYGSVFKGILDPDGTVVAVKILNLVHRGALKSFMAECEALRNIRHRNLVKVLSACSGVDYKGNDFKALVYEFMANGSLEDWLHHSEGQNEFHVNFEQKRLSLVQRLNIVIDVANALDYLHNHCDIPIVHCDLKPGNVLLDNDFVGHVGDFGLARFLSKDEQPRTNITSSRGIRGSIGYTAPEYGIGSEISTYGDVYSFGILLLEMLTGKRPTNDMFQDGLDLRTFIVDSLPDRLEEIVDPVLLQEIEEGTSTTRSETNRSKQTQRFWDCLIAIFEIGLSCSVESARDRMCTDSIVSKLQSIKNVLLKT
ncbi:putative LRR receptor-like serine/threonine-protein kinase [Abeliophyllum distichum]|uniref:non-specific serine/threonine protein kinase n=1 Tax=Abeliophyllum distichum TaxID=126358 RepID=A0ABD1VTY1_9LAMI